MYSDVFCRVYNELGWNSYPEVFGQQLLQWLRAWDIRPEKALDLACGTGILCGILQDNGIRAAGMDFSAGMIEIAREQNPGVEFDVADMVTYRPEARFDLVTCTGDALNHIPELTDVAQIFRNVWDYLNPGGYFVFDLLSPREISDSEPFELDFTDSVRVWFQMTRPGENRVSLTVRVFEQGVQTLEEVIQETVHDCDGICRMLETVRFRVVRCDHSLLDNGNPVATWYVIARKPGPNAEDGRI